MEEILALKLKFNYKIFTKNVVNTARDKSRKSLDYSGGIIRNIAKRSIKYRKKFKNKSAKGTPPHTHGKKKLRNSIFFARSRNNESVLVGPLFSRVRDVGKAHEFGGPYKMTSVGRDNNGVLNVSRNSKSHKKNLTTRPRIYPKRPFMYPALKNALPKLPIQFQNIL